MFKVNDYFDGKIKSLSFNTTECPATVGVIAPGEYEFGTVFTEYITLTSGNLRIKLPDHDEWKEYNKGQTFRVPSNTKFRIRTETETSYLCLYKLESAVKTEDKAHITEEPEKKKWSKIRLNYSFWMTTDDGQTVISDERLALLMGINEHGTLRKAAKAMNISYRKAWGDLKETEKLVGLPLIEKHRGGKEGGSTVLTRDGKILINAYKVFREEFQESVSDIIRKFKRTLKDS